MLTNRLTLDLHDPRGPSFDGKARPARRHHAATRDASEYVRLFARALYTLPADVIAASVMINLLGLALPLAILQVYDRVIHNSASTTLLFLILCVCTALVFEAILRITRSQVIAWSAMKEAWESNVGAASRVALAPARLVDREPAAYWIQRFQAVNTASEFKLSPSMNALVDLPFVLIFLGLLFVISPLLATIPLVLFVLFMIKAFGYGRKLRATTAARAHAEASVRDFLVEALNGIVTVKAFAMEQQVLRRFERLAEQASGCNYNLVRLTNDAQSLGSLALTLTQLTTITVGAIITINGDITIGALACCTMLSGRVMQPLIRVVSAWNEIHAILVAGDTARPIFDLPASRRFKPALGAQPLPARVTFGDVTFRHDGETAPVLAGANLTVEPGEIIAITGSNGSGRSTAMQLALGQLVPQSGQVLIDDIPAVMAGTGICGTLALVDHHVASIRGTVLNNLTMFRDGEGIETAEAVANLMGLQDDIHRLPRGYDTRLGEAATEGLPPGLMQRIVVARAVASRPRLIVIDQANSSFDQRGDRMLARGISSLKGSITIILITNQPSLIAIADRVVMIDGGKFVEINDRLSSEKAIT
jgi:ATP-binding cassette subfamily C protein LapB